MNRVSYYTCGATVALETHNCALQHGAGCDSETEDEDGLECETNVKLKLPRVLSYV